MSPTSGNPLIFQEFCVRAAVSLIVLIFCGFIIASPKTNPQLKHWACGIVGLIVGYWLKT